MNDELLPEQLEVINQLVLMAKKNTESIEILDGMVHDAKSLEATTINNKGFKAQITYLVLGGSADDVATRLKEANGD